jgi:nicotinamide-nucleotide amidase
MPSFHQTAAILSIGDELTLGQTLDTNSRFLADALLSRGIVTVEHATVADDRAATAAAIQRLAIVADLVIITGGLGPTADDLTRAGLAEALGEDLVEDPAALAEVTAFFTSRRSAMRDINKTQALRPRSAMCLTNPNGTAPGLHAILHREGREVDVFCLPGPPREMKPMFDAEVVPRLRIAPGRTVATRALHCFGLGESEIAARLGELMDRDRNPTVGTTASQGVVSCRIRCTGPNEAQVRTAVAETERTVRDKAGPYMFGADTDTLPSVVLDLLRARREMLATVESCTGGLLGAALTDIPGSSDVYSGGWVTYTNEFKAAHVAVPESLFDVGGPGAVSEETAAAMAVGGLDRSGADHCLAITGIAGPGGGTDQKPVGTVWISRASRGQLASASGGPVPHRVESRRFQLMGERAMIRDWSVKSALAMLRFFLISEPDVRLMREVQR